jgi:beta-ribofuranosylaminobenzene 5'-phosphate synthase
MTRVRAPSRLHFGLFHALPEPGAARQFGGVGLMVADPGLTVTARPAGDWSADGPLAGRALDFARRFAATVEPGRLPPHTLFVETTAPEHTGLGTGTQLGLAVARALATSAGLDLGVAELARRTGRGRRSAVGVHGFARGGFIVEAGRRGGDALGALVVRADFPPDWRLVLACPAGAAGLFGPDEARVFASPTTDPAAARRADELCRLVLLEMLPALAATDLAAFGAALTAFNRTAGAPFAPHQGGPYAPAAAEQIGRWRAAGAVGIGQSSWGPTAFAVAADPAQADALARAVGAGQGVRVWVTAASAAGAAVTA